MSWLAAQLVLVDRDRADLFGRLAGWPRLVRFPDVWQDTTGVWWAGARRGRHWLAWTWFGPGWVFDRHAQHRWADEYGRRRRDHDQADEHRHRLELAAVAHSFRIGETTGRLLWAIYQAVRAARSSVLTLPERALGEAVWGPDRHAWPQHWRGNVVGHLRALTWLHVATAEDGGRPELGPATSLLTHAAMLGGTDADECDDTCPGRGCPPHRHVAVTAGQGLLGVLERCGCPGPQSGERAYDFSSANFREAGRTGRLVTVFLPAEHAGSPAAPTFTPNQRGLLRAFVRELTRPSRGRPGRGTRSRQSTAAPQGTGEPASAARAAVVEGDRLPNIAGRRTTACPLLAADGRYVSFNGNGVRPGLGYKLGSPNGWLARAGYAAYDYRAFLADLRALTGPLGLVAVGLTPRDNGFLALGELWGLTQTARGRARLAGVHLRVYTAADWLERWPAIAGREITSSEAEGADDAGRVLAAVLTEGTPLRRIARDLPVDPSFLAKVAGGKKPCPGPLLARLRGWLGGRGGCSTLPQSNGPSVGHLAADEPAVDAALRYLDRGWSVVPQRRGYKCPAVRWKRFQTRRPTETEIRNWYDQSPDAGISAVLGPVSDLFVIDVDGQAAHDELVRRLDDVPAAPKAHSGSGDPYRYHLYFRHPAGMQTRAKATPWHDKLEFKGRGATIVLPPSVHPSGRRYAWADGRSPDDLPLADLPAEIVAALARPRPTSEARPAPVTMPAASGRGMSRTTAQFLRGDFANGPGWNNRLFGAACDLKAGDWPEAEAQAALLAGARPWDESQAAAALATIRSAFERPREPSRH